MSSRKRDVWLVLTSSACTAIIVAGLTFGVRALAALDSNDATDTLPRVVPYEGVIDLDGSPYSGFLDFRFTLYDDPTGGDAVWTEDWTQAQSRAIQVYSGRFAASLGAFDDGGLRSLSDVIADADPVYLGVQVKHTSDADDAWVSLNGRQRLNPVPYALWSNKASSLAVAGNASVGGTLGVTGNTTLGGNATVSGTLSAGSTTVNGTLHSTGATTVDGTLSAPGGLQATGGIANASGDVTVGDNLAVTGTSDLRGNVANSTGDVTVGDNLAVTGTTDLRGNVANSTGDVTVGDNLAVTGNLTVSGTLLTVGAEVSHPSQGPADAVGTNLGATGRRFCFLSGETYTQNAAAASQNVAPTHSCTITTSNNNFYLKATSFLPLELTCYARCISW